MGRIEESVIARMNYAQLRTASWAHTRAAAREFNNSDAFERHINRASALGLAARLRPDSEVREYIRGHMQQRGLAQKP